MLIKNNSQGLSSSFDASQTQLAATLYQQKKKRFHTSTKLIKNRGESIEI